MSALDDAIAAELAHPAGAGADPLTDSLASQVCAPPLRAGWDHEPIAVPLPWRWMLLAFLLAAMGFTLPGCSSPPQPREPSARVLASCPPLREPPARNDAQAQTRRIAELETWYTFCREAALGEPHTLFTPDAPRFYPSPVGGTP